MAQHFRAEFMQIPVVTRVYCTTCILTTLAVVRLVRPSIVGIIWKYVHTTSAPHAVYVVPLVSRLANSPYLPTLITYRCTLSFPLQQLEVVTPIQLLYHPQLVLQGEVCSILHTPIPLGTFE